MKRPLAEVNVDDSSIRGRTRASTKKIVDQLNVSVIKVTREEEICQVEAKIDDNHIEVKIDVYENEFVGDVKCGGCKKTCKHTTILMQWWKIKGCELEEANPKRIKLEDYSPKENRPTLKIPKKTKTPLPKHLENSEAGDKLMVQHFANLFDGKTFEDFVKFSSEFMNNNSHMLEEAEMLTLDQADTDAWHNLRVGRLTASRLYEATRCTMMKGSFADKVLNVKKGGFSFAMKRGTVLEDEVFDELKKEYPSLKKAGLILNPDYPFFGASPDGLGEDFVLEIKCPYTPHTHATYIDVNKLSKKYFAQIQLQMHLANRTKALLGVADVNFESNRNITKIWIPYDKEYTEQMMEDALYFWQKAIFPAIMRRSVKHKK